MSTQYIVDASTTREAIIEQGQQVYDERLKADLERRHRGRFVAIEPFSGDYFLGDTSAEALIAAHGAFPDRRFYLLRIGFDAAHTIGGHVAR